VVSALSFLASLLGMVVNFASVAGLNPDGSTVQILTVTTIVVACSVVLAWVGVHVWMLYRYFVDRKDPEHELQDKKETAMGPGLLWASKANPDHVTPFQSNNFGGGAGGIGNGNGIDSDGFRAGVTVDLNDDDGSYDWAEDEEMEAPRSLALGLNGAIAVGQDMGATWEENTPRSETSIRSDVGLLATIEKAPSSPLNSINNNNNNTKSLRRVKLAEMQRDHDRSTSSFLQQEDVKSAASISAIQLQTEASHRESMHQQSLSLEIERQQKELERKVQARQQELERQTNQNETTSSVRLTEEDVNQVLHPAFFTVDDIGSDDEWLE